MRISDWSSDVCSSDLAHPHSGRDTPQIRFADISPHINRSIKAEAIDRALADSHAAGFAHPCDDRAGAGCKQNRVGERGGGLSPCCLCGGEARLPRRDVFLAEAFGGLRMRGPGRLDTGGGLIARSARGIDRSEEHTSELQSLMRISYAVFRFQKKTNTR